MNAVRALEATLALLRTRPVGRWPEELRSWGDLAPVLAAIGIRRDDRAAAACAGEDGRPPDARDEDTLEEIRGVRDALVVPVFSASDAEAAKALNALSVRYGLRPWLDSERGEAAHRGRDGRLATRLVAALVPGLMQARADGLVGDVGVCADVACDTPFLDRTGDHRRRYCSTRCATRARVAEHRRQRRT